MCAAGETRTLIPLRETAPKAVVSTNFTTAACNLVSLAPMFDAQNKKDCNNPRAVNIKKNTVITDPKTILALG